MGLIVYSANETRGSIAEWYVRCHALSNSDILLCSFMRVWSVLRSDDLSSSGGASRFVKELDIPHEVKLLNYKEKEHREAWFLQV